MTSIVIPTPKGREPTLPAFLLFECYKAGVVLGGVFGDRSGGKIAVPDRDSFIQLTEMSNSS